MADSILVIGSGGREHALAWKLAQSASVKHVFVAPGNAGTCSDNSGKISNHELNIKNHEEITKWCQEKKINLVVVGPEDPLANGIADHLTKNNIKCFGPCQKAAQIEASKEFAKDFMDRFGIPTARWKSFTDANQAKDHISSASYDALVIKASGLAAGKGVIVADSKENAIKAVDMLKQDKGLSSASEIIVIEELLQGEEVSVLCFSDGTHISVMPPAQDHKRLLDNDEGPNTGGMGAYCRCPQISDQSLEFIKTNILQKAIDGMRKEGCPYVGVLYAGLMMTKDGPKVLEFNCRCGDPETQVILPLLKSDLYDVMLSCVNGNLNNMQIQWEHEKYAVGVVVVSGGYPGSYPKGKIITGFDKLTDHIVFHAGTALSSGNIVTSGGRVLAVVAVEDTLQKAAAKAESGAKNIVFDGAFYRKDIAYKALKRLQHEGMTYKSSGVDIESADALVDKIKVLTKQTIRPGICGGIGGFGGIFDLKASGYVDPYLVSIGTGLQEKLLAAQECGEYERIGYDLVSNCVNSILFHGAEPLFFLDTFTTGKLDTNIAAKVIEGIVKGCKEANCALIGGETAEMPGMYADGDFDLTGFARGAVEREQLLPHETSITEQDSVIGLISSSLNCHGFEVIRKLLKREQLSYDSPSPFDENSILRNSLLQPNKLHVKSLLPLIKKGVIKAAIFINEGLMEDVSKILPSQYKINLDASKWKIPLIFDWIKNKTNFTENEMLETFNFGIDFILIIDEKLTSLVLEELRNAEEKAVVIGSVESCDKGEARVQISNSPFKTKQTFTKVKVAVLTSGQGCCTEALIKYAQNPVSSSEIAIVMSDSSNSKGTVLAKEAKIETMVCNNEDLSSEDKLEKTIHNTLMAKNVEILCLDNFATKMSDNFIKMWQGKILNIHPSLLPAFVSSNPLEEMLLFKSRATGCTVYFVEPEKTFGGIIDQAAAHVAPEDTKETLNQKLIELQQYVYPKALELVANKQITYESDSSLKRLNDINIVFPLENKEMHNDTRTKIHTMMTNTARPGVMKCNYSCGIFDLKASGYQDPYLVSGTDGVGTKLKIAQICNKHNTIGIDLVAMCVNDILTHGAEPLFFMDCFNCAKFKPDIALEVISGIAEGCKQANCSLISNETAVLPEIYLNSNKCVPDFGNYDVIGYAEGALAKSNLLPKLNEIKEGDILIGLASSGIHSNGYSLVRKIVKVRNLRYQDPAPFESNGKTLGEVLLTPTKIYVRSLLPLMKKGFIKAAAHITGGGITENIPRVLPSKFKVVLDGKKWAIPPVLQWIAHEGKLSDKEMLKTFNCGLGMVLIINKENEKEVTEHLKASGETAANIGQVSLHKTGEEKVQVHNFSLNICSSNIKRKKVGVLISGSGTNLQALIDYTQNPSNQSKAEIALVLSNVPGVEGLKRAERANIPTKVLSHKAFKSRVEFDMAVNSILNENKIDIVCLAGFMRILSKEFVELWQGKLLNVHPAILPAFKGMNAHKLVLEAGARITGCTVHFVEPEVDAGAVIEQAAVRVDIDDTEKSLQEKVKVLEHQIFPTALELLASERISRGPEGKLLWHF